MADVFTALTEDRPYRKGMSETDAFQIISEAVTQHRLDRKVVNILHDHLDELNRARQSAQDVSQGGIPVLRLRRGATGA